MGEEREGKDFIGVGGGVIIMDSADRILLIKRGAEVRNEPGFWSKPGGTVDYGEKVVEAMRREIKEELDIDIEIIGQLPHTDHIISSAQQHWIALNFIARITSGEPKNMEPHKCDEIAWFALDELPEKITQTTREPIAHYMSGQYIQM